MMRTYGFQLFGDDGESRGQVSAHFVSDEHARAAALRLVTEHGLIAVRVMRGAEVLFTVSDEESAA